MPLSFGQRGWAAGPMPFQNPVHPILLPMAQPKANFCPVDFKSIGDFGSSFPFHVEGHGMEPAGHAIAPFPKGLLAELNQLSDLSRSSMNFNRSHVTSYSLVTCYIM